VDCWTRDLVFGSHCPDSARTGDLAGARYITLQKQAEATSILEERNRMAREIHDTLAQAFTGILPVGAANRYQRIEATQAHPDLIKELARTGLD